MSLGYSITKTLTNSLGVPQRGVPCTVTSVTAPAYTGTVTSDPLTGAIQIGPLPLGRYLITATSGYSEEVEVLTTADAQTVVTHGSNSGLTRPTSTLPVKWFGTVAPLNATTNDEWYDQTTLLLKTYNGTAWVTGAFAKPSPVPTVSGSRASGTALASLLTALAAQGLIIDGTTA